jgi:hypothetical protein
MEGKRERNVEHSLFFCDFLHVGSVWIDECDYMRSIRRAKQQNAINKRRETIVSLQTEEKSKSE